MMVLSHCLKKGEPSSIGPHGVTRPQWGYEVRMRHNHPGLIFCLLLRKWLRLLYHTLQWRHMTFIAAQITGNTTICLISCPGEQQRYHQRSALLVLVRKILRIPLTNGQLYGKRITYNTYDGAIAGNIEDIKEIICTEWLCSSDMVNPGRHGLTNNNNWWYCWSSSDSISWLYTDKCFVAVMK